MDGEYNRLPDPATDLDTLDRQIAEAKQILAKQRELADLWKQIDEAIDEATKDIADLPPPYVPSPPFGPIYPDNTYRPMVPPPLADPWIVWEGASSSTPPPVHFGRTVTFRCGDY